MDRKQQLRILHIKQYKFLVGLAFRREVVTRKSGRQDLADLQVPGPSRITILCSCFSIFAILALFPKRCPRVGIRHQSFCKARDGNKDFQTGSLPGIDTPVNSSLKSHEPYTVCCSRCRLHTRHSNQTFRKTLNTSSQRSRRETYPCAGLLTTRQDA